MAALDSDKSSAEALVCLAQSAVGCVYRPKCVSSTRHGEKPALGPARSASIRAAACLDGLDNGGVVDYGFAPGSTAQDKRARNLFSRRANTTLVAPKSLATVRAFANFLRTSGTVTRPIDDALIGAHASSEGWLLISMFPKQKGATSFETLKEAVDNASKSIAIDDIVIGYSTGDPITHHVHFKGCNIGKARPFLVKFKEALGDHVIVTAPKHFHGLSDYPDYGTFENMAYEFSVQGPAPFATRAELLTALDDQAFKFIGGSGVTTADWDKWVPKKIDKTIKTPVSIELGVTLGKRKTIEVEREFRVKKLPYNREREYIGGPPPSTPAAQQAAFEASVRADDAFKPAHPYPEYERMGYSTIDEFFAGHTWTYTVKKQTLYTVGIRVKYTVVRADRRCDDRQPRVQLSPDSRQTVRCHHQPERKRRRLLRAGLMADEEDTLDVLVEELGLALDPLVAAFSSAAAFRDFLEDLGWDFNAAPAALDALRTPIGQANTGAQGEIPAGQRADMRNRIQTSFEAISSLGSGGGLPAEFANEFPRQLVDYLLVTWLLRHQPRIGYVLMLMGIVRLEAKPSTATRPAYLQRKFAFEDLGAFFQNPIEFWKNTYRWGQSTFDGERLIDGFYGLFDAWDWRVREEILDDTTAQQLSVGALDPASVSPLNLRLVFFEEAIGALGVEAGVGMFLLPETASAKPGFSLMPYGRGGLDVEIPLSDLLTLGIKAGIDLAGGVGVNVRPNKDIEFFAGLGAGTPSAVSGNVSALLRLGKEGEPLIIIGAKNQSRLEFGAITTEAGTRFHSGGKFEVFTEFNLQDGKIVVKPSEQDKDGFIAKLLPAEGLEIGIKLNVGFSTTQGLYFGGSGGLEITIPTHITLGPVEITSALIGVKFKDGAIPVDLAATIKADLSVIKGTVENIGLTATFSFPPDRKGNLGPVNLGLGFRPPNGVGLADRRRRRQGRRLSLLRLRQGGIRRRARADVRGLPVAQGDRPDQHEDARRHAGLLAADHHHAPSSAPASSSATASR